jgi:hypothetical protein
VMAAPAHLRLVSSGSRTLPDTSNAKPKRTCSVCRMGLDDGIRWEELVCNRCGAGTHEPCYWRSRPLHEWIVFVVRVRDLEDDDPVWPRDLRAVPSVTVRRSGMSTKIKGDEMLITPDSMVSILSAGGGLRISTRGLTVDTLMRLANAASSSGATLILHDLAFITSDNMVQTGHAGGGRVIFEVERDVPTR